MLWTYLVDLSGLALKMARAEARRRGRGRRLGNDGETAVRRGWNHQMSASKELILVVCSRVLGFHLCCGRAQCALGSSGVLGW